MNKITMQYKNYIKLYLTKHSMGEIKNKITPLL